MEKNVERDELGIDPHSFEAPGSSNGRQGIHTCIYLKVMEVECDLFRAINIEVLLLDRFEASGGWQTNFVPSLCADANRRPIIKGQISSFAPHFRHDTATNLISTAYMFEIISLSFSTSCDLPTYKQRG